MGEVAFVQVEEKYFIIQDNRFSSDPSINRGMPSGSAYDSIRPAGDWPQTGFVIADRSDYNHKRTELFFWDGQRWKPKFQTSKSTLIRQLGTWNQRRVLALLHDVDTGKPSFRVIAGFPSAPVPQVEKQEGCGAVIDPSHASILRSGFVFAAGRLCHATNLAVIQWQPNSKEGQKLDLPDSDDMQLAGIVALDSTTAFVAGSSKTGKSAYFARWMGESWERVAMPFDAGITHMTADPKGAVWMTTSKGQLWVRRKDGLTQVVLPLAPGDEQRIRALFVWSPSSADTWVVGEYGTGDSKRGVLMNTRALDGPRPSFSGSTGGEP
jgi:hypothetical protein